MAGYFPIVFEGEDSGVYAASLPVDAQGATHANPPAVLATFYVRESRGAAVVMMKPVEDWQRHDVPGEFSTPANCSWWRP